ncbi:hypothetical protein ABTI69_20805, partial [Acinetobacter baumannii]
DSTAYRAASRRVLRQLVDAMLFENALPHGEWHGEDLAIQGRAADGGGVLYRCRARRSFSFGRVRLVSPLLREAGGGGAEEAADPALFLA